MQLKNVIIGLAAVLLVVMIAIIGYILISGGTELFSEKQPSTFSVLETGAAGNNIYAVYNYRANGNLTVLSYQRQPKRNVVIINDSQAVDAGRLPELVDQLKKLEDYGFNVSVTDEPKIGDGIYVIPTGAIPSYALFNLEQNSSNGTLIYIGAKDLLLSSGIKQLNWYNSLSPEQRNRIVQYDGTLGDFLDGQKSLNKEILYNSWAANQNATYALSGSGIKTAVVPFNHTGYMRMIYEFDDVSGIYDTPYIQSPDQVLTPNPQEIFPWEKSSLQFLLNATNGTAFLSIKKDGKLVEHEQLRRVTDENVFIKKLEYTDPGQYVIVVDDSSNVIASGLLSVTDIQIKLLQRQGVTYIFSVTVDGKPMQNSEAQVSLGNSTKKKYYISDGIMTVNAKLTQGKNLFNVDIDGSTIPVEVDNNQDPFFDFYLKYGIPGLGIVFVVYFGARMTKRPTYRLRFGDSASYIRQEMTLPVDRAVESLQRIRSDMKLGKSPVTMQEFSVSLKRYLTNGADVTEGNVEEILKKLVKSGHLESHRDFYQLPGEGDIKKNALSRMVREKLIESGTPFREEGGKFIAKDLEIGFFGAEFERKGVIVVDDVSEEKSLLGSLSRAELSRIRLMQANDMLSIITIDRLSDIL